MGDVPRTNANLTFGGLLQACNHPQQRRLTTTGRPDKNTKLAIFHGEVYAMDHLGLSVGLHQIG